MFAKTILTLFAVTARVAVATPPACLLAAVNTQPDPSALKAVCGGSNATQVVQTICKNCGGDDVRTALGDFASVCRTVGVTISNSSGCSSASSSSASSASASHTGSAGGLILATGASSGVATVTNTTGGHNGPLATSNGEAAATATATSAPSGGSGSSAGTESAASASATATAASTGAYNGVAARLGMDVVGLLALGAFGGMMAL